MAVGPGSSLNLLSYISSFHWAMYVIIIKSLPLAWDVTGRWYVWQPCVREKVLPWWKEKNPKEGSSWIWKLMLMFVDFTACCRVGKEAEWFRIQEVLGKCGGIWRSNTGTMQWRCMKLMICTLFRLVLLSLKMVWAKDWPTDCVNGVLRRTVVDDWHFSNLCECHLQSQAIVTSQLLNNHFI